MFRALALILATAGVTAAVGIQQLSNDPYAPIDAASNVVAVGVAEFATIPDAAGNAAPRMMMMVDEPGTKRLFVSTMLGAIYGVSYDGKTVSEYLDVNAAKWN